ncbi:TetR/AcrR family transcriptional regulator [Virgibacillus ndiopensis]|uniref:TetR/AcrR family transcriptional regulator n=1 Tax=Virgibacillus ndiopensis TaxID=2004408 RepID=UPI000C068F3D|nr:TetR/AcrR family transcriptional regulator [Virgibacillus ndiopensis]
MAPRISEEAKEEKRLALLDAALECFSQKGYYASSVDDIVRYSNLSKGSVYNYFNSKEDIFISLLQHQTKTSLERLNKVLSEIKSPLEKLKYWINLDIPFNIHKKKMMRVHIEFWMYSADSPDVKKVMTDRFDTVLKIVKDIIAEGKEAGEFRKDVDPEKAAGMFWALHDGLWLHTLVRFNEKELEERIKEIETTMLAYLT